MLPLKRSIKHKMRRISGLFLLFLVSFTSLAQKEEGEAYRFPTSVPSSYNIHPQTLYDSIRGVSGLAPEDVEEEQVKKFAEEQSYGLQSIFHNGDVYLGWKEMEAYLNDVLRQAISEDKYSLAGLRVYPATSTGWNARVFFDGTILVDINFIADLNSEAELAFVLAHEAAHYFEKDIRNRYFRTVDEKARRKRRQDYKVEQLGEAIEQASYSQKDEMIADSIGATYAHEAGYDLKGGVRNFRKMRRYKDFYEGVDSADGDYASDEEVEGKEAIDGLFSSHPKLKERIKKLEHLRYKLENEGEAFMVSEERFQKLRKEAREETAKLLLDQGDYEDCTLRSLKFHLLDPENARIREYLVKSLRRELLVFPEKKNKGFLQWVHYQTEGDSLSAFDDLSRVIMDSLRLAELDSSQLFKGDSVSFRTYEEAYRHFNREALTDEEPYALLNKGIDHHLRFNYEKRDSFLDLYTEAPDAEHIEFAKAFRKEELYSGAENGRSLLFVTRFQFVEDHPYGYHRRFLKEDEEAEEYLEGLNDLLVEEFPSEEDLELIYLPEYREKHMRSSIMAQRGLQLILEYSEQLFGKKIEQGSRQNKSSIQRMVEERIEEEKNDTNLFLLAPEYWEFFNSEGISSMEFLFTFGFDDRVKWKKSIVDAVNPWFYLSSVWRFNAAYRTGAERFYSQVGHIGYNPWKREIPDHYLESFPYRLTKNNFLNAAYYAIGWSKWEDD